jgi:acyl-CoA synthetase (NDP forming)
VDPKTTEVLGDHAARLAPLTDADADKLIGSIRSAPLLLGHRGSQPADLGALRDLLLRVSRLADDLPRSQSSPSTRSSPARTGRPWWTRGSE